MARNEDVDGLVVERLRWLNREIESREESIAGTEAMLERDRAKQTKALGERARLLAFLPADFEMPPEEKAEAADG